MSIINSQPLIGASGNQSTAYNLTRSLRFRSGASAYLSRTPASAGNRQKWTWSAWVKRCDSSTNRPLFTAYSDASNRDVLQFDSTTIQYVNISGGSANTNLVTTQVFRDFAGWYHIVFVADTTQATASNRFKLYVNGTQVTSFGTATYPSQNTNTMINNNVGNYIGREVNGSQYAEQYMADVRFIDGQALTPASFGETDTITGVWKPKAYTGTYGTNGFYLKFNNIASTSTLGNDSSGNGNTWTVNNVSLTSGTTYDSMTDVPTLTSATAANYCVLNPLDLGQTSTVTEGNLRFASSSNANYSICRGSIGVSSGKWYWEVTANNASTGNGVGIAKSTAAINNYLGSDASGYCYFGNGDKYNNGTGAAYGATYTTNDVIGVALDMDAGTLVFYKNNTSQGTAYSSISGTVFPSVTDGSGGAVSDLTSNFGQRPFAYTPPSGFVALNTFNI